MPDREASSALEQQFYKLRDEIIDALKNKGGDPNIRLQNVGRELIRIVSNENRGGGLAIMLHVTGEWSMKFDMAGFSLGNDVSIFEILLYAAEILDENLMAILNKKDDLELQDKLIAAYVKKNYTDLLHRLVESMKITLQGLA